MAISAALLTHTVTLKRAVGMTRERQKTYEEYTLAAVRVVPKAGKTISTAGEASSDSAVLFVDAARSYIVDTASDEDSGEEAAVSKSAESEESTEEDEATQDADSSSAVDTIIAPMAGDEVVFEGRLYVVQSVATVHARGGAVHHWEATMA